MVTSNFNFSSESGIRGWGRNGCEVVAAPMRDSFTDNAVVSRILSPETTLVSLSQTGSPNGGVASELNALVQFFPDPTKRRVTTFNHIDFAKLVQSDDILRDLIARKLKLTDAQAASLTFSALRADIGKTLERLDGVIDRSHEAIFGYRYIPPGHPAAKWHHDSYKERNIIRAVRGLTGAGMDIALRDNFTTSATKRRGQFTVREHGSTALGLNVLRKHPDDDCPLHRISASDTVVNRWSYVLDGRQACIEA